MNIEEITLGQAVPFLEAKREHHLSRLLNTYHRFDVDEADGASIKDEFQSYLWSFSSTDAPYEFLNVCSLVDYDPWFVWPYFHHFWSDFDAIPHREFEKILCTIWGDWSPTFIEDADDRAFYGALPDEVVAYRGQPRGARVGLSWTLDKNIAAGFARGHRGIWYDDPVIITARIKKKNIAGAYVNRGESELVLFNSRCATRRQIEQTPSFKERHGLLDA
ncbi:hypothetical protein [Methylocystis sp.]|uniref:hypothetical protein n=1 Tax=Methylocystis sp. TaxID=1911079 RepID=UPI003DA68F85